MEKQSYTKFICVSGNIGTGKTTLVQSISSLYGWHVIPEPHEENPYLARFYKDKRRWAFHSQRFFLKKRLSLYRKCWEEQGIIVQDRTIFEDAEIFARNLFLTNEFDKKAYYKYEELYKLIARTIKPPDVLVYLYAPIEELLNRIEKRGRAYEKNITLEYINQLNVLYEEWVNSFDKCPIIKIDTTKIDFIKNIENIRLVGEEILKLLAGQNLEEFFFCSYCRSMNGMQKVHL